MHSVDDEMDCALAKFTDDMNLGEEEDVLKGRGAILPSWRNPVKFRKNKSKVLHLEWSQLIQQVRLQICCAKKESQWAESEYETAE